MRNIACVRILCVVGVYLLFTIILVVVVASVAVHAGPDLGTNTGTVADLELLDLGPYSLNFTDLSSVLASYYASFGELTISCPVTKGVMMSPHPPVIVWTSLNNSHVKKGFIEYTGGISRSADTAVGGLDFDIIVFHAFRLEIDDWKGRGR